MRVLILLVSIVLVAAACGGSSTEVGDPASGNTASGDSVSGDASTVAEQTAPVVVEGEALPAFPEGVPYALESTVDPAVGMIAPTISGTDFDGAEVSVTPDGTPKVVMFVAHWCPHCQNEVPVVIDLIANGSKPDNLSIVLVSTAPREGESNYPPQTWLETEQWDQPVMRDGADFEALRAYGAGGFPYTVYLSGDNEVVARSAGELPSDTIEQLWLAAAES